MIDIEVIKAALEQVGTGREDAGKGRGHMVEPDVEQTILVMRMLHEGQVDAGGQPYYLHPLAVCALLGPDASVHERLTALLHDSLEDVVLYQGTPRQRRLERADLAWLGYGPATINSIGLLTRSPETEGAVLARPGESGAQRADRAYLDKIRALVASGDRTAIKVKRADNQHNSDPARDIHLKPEKMARSRVLKARYAASMEILDQGLANLDAMVLGRAGPAGH